MHGDFLPIPTIGFTVLVKGGLYTIDDAGLVMFTLEVEQYDCLHGATTQ